MNRFLSAALLLLFSVTWSASAPAQSSRLIMSTDPEAVWIERLQQRGHLGTLPATVWPVSVSSLREATAETPRSALDPIARTWMERLRDLIGVPETPNADSKVPFRLLGDGRAGAFVGNSVRVENALRPAPPSEAQSADILLPLGDEAVILPYADARVTGGKGPLAATVGLRFDLAYRADPDGLNVTRFLETRATNSYLALNGNLAGLTAGRFPVHWAAPRSPSLFVSDHPRNMDHVGVRLGRGTLTIRGLVGELDAVLPEGPFDGRAGAWPPDPNVQQRVLSARRVDWRPSRALTLSYLESAVTSGSGSGLTLATLLPTNLILFVTDETPKNAEINGFVGLGARFQKNGWTAEAQGLLDDFDFRLDEPPSVAGTLTLTRAGVTPTLDLGARVQAITSRVYNTNQLPGTYVYARRGIGLPFSDFVQADLFAEVFAWPERGLALQPKLSLLWQGEADFLDPFPDNDSLGTILTGDVTQTTRLGLGVEFRPSRHVFATLDAGVNRSEQRGEVDYTAVILARAGVRVLLSEPFSLDL